MRAAAFLTGVPPGVPLLLVALALTLVVMVAVCWRAIMAERRAATLLRDVLTDAEYEGLVNRGYLEIASPSMWQRVYRVPRAGGRVRVYEQERLICELCLRPTRLLPPSDVLLLHKLMIEGDEATYLVTANHFAWGDDAHAGPPIFWYL